MNILLFIYFLLMECFILEGASNLRRMRVKIRSNQGKNTIVEYSSPKKGSCPNTCYKSKSNESCNLIILFSIQNIFCLTLEKEKAPQPTSATEFMQMKLTFVGILTNAFVFKLQQLFPFF